MGTKAEARELRQKLKQIHFEAKKARQAEQPDVAKRVSQVATPSAEKNVKEAAPSIGLTNMEWSREEADTDGEWTWGPRSCLDDDWDAELHPFLEEYARKTWNEIHAERTGNKRSRRQKHIDYSVGSICQEAQSRLVGNTRRQRRPRTQQLDVLPNRDQPRRRAHDHSIRQCGQQRAVTVNHPIKFFAGASPALSTNPANT